MEKNCQLTYSNALLPVVLKFNSCWKSSSESHFCFPSADGFHESGSYSFNISFVRRLGSS